MKFYDKRFCIYKDWITIIPTIDIHINVTMLELPYRTSLVMFSRKVYVVIRGKER